jgi:ribosome-binding factor A
MTSALSQRQLRFGETVRHALGEMLTRDEVQDPIFDMRLITVPEVRMSPDLKHATVFIMPLGGRDMEGAIAAMRRNASFMRGALAKKLKAKFTPDLHFHIDDSFERGAKIDNLLRNLSGKQ